MNLNKLTNFFLLIVLVASILSCKTKNDLDAFKEAKYDLAGISQIDVNGINMLEKKGPQSFSFSEAATLFSAFSENKFDAITTLGLNVELDEANQDRTVTVTQLKWQLLINDEKEISGMVSEPIQLRHGLNTLTVRTPIVFNEEKGKPNLNNLVRLASLLQQDGAQKPNIKLQIKPTLQTSVGALEFPGFISIK